MMQYRAVLHDPGSPLRDRPVQILTNSLREVDNWIAEVLGGGTHLQGPAKIEVSPQAKVFVYASEERLTATYDVETARQIRDRKLQRDKGAVEEIQS